MSWFRMVTPSEPEMVAMLRVLYGPDWFRQPKRKWEDLWRLRRGELNQILGMRRFKTLRKYQRGSVGQHPHAAHIVPAGTVPELTDVTHTVTGATPIRIHVRYFTDGELEWDTGGTIGSIVYAKMTTDTDDANDHTNEWWPDHPDTDEGLNWDIRYTNLVTASVQTTHIFANAGVDLVEDVWDVLDDISDFSADGSNDGALVTRKVGKETGTATLETDVEIRTTGSGSAVASHTVDIVVTVV